MAACPRCGSRSIRLVINPLTWLAHLITERRASKCPRCGWRGWKHKKEWSHIAAAGVLRGGTGHSGPRKVERRDRRSPETARPFPHDTVPSLTDAEFQTVVTTGSVAPDLEALDRTMDESASRQPPVNP